VDPALAPLIIAGLAAVSAGGLAYALVFQRISDASARGKRLEKLQGAPKLRDVRKAPDQQLRRARVQEALKEVDDKAKRQARKLSLKTSLSQAGLGWSVRTFAIASAGLGLLAFLMVLLATGKLAFAAAAAFVGALGLPRLLLRTLRKRRQKAFIEEFPNAVDVIVRGIKAGLPLNDCLRVIAQESAEPVRSEFRYIVEAQTLGIPTGDAVEKLFERMPLPEANFFAIVVAIQQKTGGNLSEALGNLSRVLRERKKMRGKIQAMSMEAKASALIIGSLPIIVMLLVHLTTPDYISVLFKEPLGHLMLGGSLFWMTCGVLVMRKMINFDF